MDWKDKTEGFKKSTCAGFRATFSRDLKIRQCLKGVSSEALFTRKYERGVMRYGNIQRFIHTAMHEEWRKGNEGRILSLQRGVEFQAHRVPHAGEIRAAFIFDA